MGCASGRPSPPQPQLLGTAASHGCVRVSDAAALRLKRLVPVGTAISIRG
jgi:lipoprotein-anchoring transpeptidase ErfK/SrfK